MPGAARSEREGGRERRSVEERPRHRRRRPKNARTTEDAQHKKRTHGGGRISFES